MHLTIRAVVILLAFAMPAWYSPSTGKYGKTKKEIQRLQHQKHELNSTWPSFINDSSYIYLLGLFIKQRISISKHLQTSAEPAMFQAAILLSQKYNITVNGKQFAYRIEDTSGRDVIETLDRTCLAISENHVLGIVGPEYSNEAKTIARFANRAGLPVVGYSTTDPELSNRNAYQTFYRLPPSDVITAQALLKLYQKYNWNSTNVIYQSDNYGEGGLKALTEVFNNEIQVSRAIKYDLFTDRIDNFQHQLEESPSRIVLVWANPNTTRKIIELALEAGNIMAPSLLWILIAPNSTMQIADNQNVNQLAGMLIVRLVTPNLFYIPTNTELLKNATAIWKEYDPQSYPNDETQIDIFALYAFDAAWLPILAIEKLCEQNPNTCLSLSNTSHCFASQLANRNELNEIIQTMSFIGVSGRVQFQSNTTDRIDGTGAHYIIDNVQPSTVDRNKLQVVEVLRLNGTTMNNSRKSAPQWMESGHAIQWPSKSLEPPRDYALLKNQKLNITVYMSSPFFMTKLDLNNISQPDGYIHDLVLSLQKRMEFNYRYIVAPIETSYDELVECVQNRTYEIVMADLSITSSRTDKIDFSHPIYDNTIRLVVRKSQKTTISPFAFFKPFSYQLWLLITLIIYLCSALLIAFYEFYGQEIAQAGGHSGNIHHDEKIITTLRSLYHTIGALVQRGSELQPKTFFGCLQTVIVWLMSIILVALLTSNLTTYFNAQREKSWVQSIDDLQMCRIVPCNRIGIIERSQHEEYFTNEVMNGIQMNYHRLKHPNECYTKLLDHHIDVALADSSSAEYYTQTPDYCQLEVAGIPFGKTYFAVALPKQWHYKQDLDKNIMDLKLSGEIDRLLAKWFQQKNCDRQNSDENNGPDDSLTIIETSGLFYIFTSITSVNFIAFVLKWLHTVYRKQHSERNEVPFTAENSALEGKTARVDEKNQVPQLPVCNLATPPPPSEYTDRPKRVGNLSTQESTGGTSNI